MNQVIRIFITLFLCGVFSLSRNVVLAQETQATENEEGKVDVSEIIFGHIGDSYEWHITTINHHPIVIPLPIIAYTDSRGWSCFSSTRLEEGESYNGFRIQRGGEYDGKLVEYQADGSYNRPMIDISITKDVAALFVNSLIILLLILGCSRWYRNRKVTDAAPKGFIGLMEMLISTIYNNVIKANIHHHVDRFAPYLLTAFFFIFINNLIGLVPGSANLTGNIAITLVLALFTFVMVNLFGTKTYWKDIFSPHVPGWLKPIMAVIEFIGIFTKPFALMIRLFANITAGHIVILGLVSVIFVLYQSSGAMGAWSMSVASFAFCLFMDCLELLVAFIQAYVFTMLSAVFIGMAQEEEAPEA